MFLEFHKLSTSTLWQLNVTNISFELNFSEMLQQNEINWSLELECYVLNLYSNFCKGSEIIYFKNSLLNNTEILPQIDYSCIRVRKT